MSELPEANIDDVDLESFSSAALSILAAETSERQDPSEILSFLYLGDYRDWQNTERMGKLGIKNIVNCCVDMWGDRANKEEANDYGGTTLCIPALDIVTHDISQFFERTTAFIQAIRDRGEKVIVHCQAGVSRSPSIVCAFLISDFGLSYQEAMYIVMKRRPCVFPNPGFCAQLKRHSERQRKKNVADETSDQ